MNALNALIEKIDVKAVYVLILLGMWLGMDIMHINDQRLFDILYSLLIGLGVLHVTSTKGLPK